MEGVVVTARQDGANFDVSVVSDAQGKYTFPRSHVGAGNYTVKIRAVGYDLASGNAVEVADGESATLDLSLDTAKDITRQLTSAEWLLSVPGTDAQKSMVQRQIESCTYCHTLERIVKSKHTAAEFVPVVTRMLKYYPDGTTGGEGGRGRQRVDAEEGLRRAEETDTWGYGPGVKMTDLGAYLATINRSGGRSLPTKFETLPRPTGKATRVIITQYDMPRKSTVPHDSAMDSKGNVWFADQSDYFITRFDPKTATFKEWPLPRASTRPFGGGSDVTVDLKDRIWFTLTNDEIPGNFGGLGYFDPQTEKYQFVDLGEPFYGQFGALGPDGSLVQGGLRIDTDTKKVIDRFSYNNTPNDPGGVHMGYEPAMDSKGNWFVTDFGASYIIRIDAKTKEVTWIKPPVGFSEPRRSKMDDQDRYWFAMYTADRIGMVDATTLKIKEWYLGIKWASPYTVSVPDERGHVYAAAGTANRVFRLDINTDEVISYIVPTNDFDAKQITIDPIDGKTIWMSNVRNASLVKIEPLD